MDELISMSRVKDDPEALRAAEVQKVRVVDVEMDFLSMVIFMVKWALASIPAVIILVIVFTVLTTFLGGALGVLFRTLSTR